MSAEVPSGAGHHGVASEHTSGPDGAPHLCSCPGTCSAVSTPALAAATLQPVVDVPTAVADPGRPAHEFVAAWVDFVLPFATAPPSRRALA